MSGRGGKRSGAGRPKGAVSQETADIKAMVVGALQSVGGEQYLAERARDQPVAFMNLVGRVLPHQISGDGTGAVTIQLITGVPDLDDDEPEEPCIHDR
jgi:hypothetical protein